MYVFVVFSLYFPPLITFTALIFSSFTPKQFVNTVASLYNIYTGYREIAFLVHRKWIKQ